MVLAFASGAVGRGGSTDVAIIIVAVLIIVPGISAANAPLLQTRKFPRWFAVSGFVRVIPPYVLLFLFGGRFLDCYIKLRKFFGICKCLDILLTNNILIQNLSGRCS